MAKEKFYITTPIYYVNDVPHIGHAYTTIAADVLSRYHKLSGDNVFFLTGTDEHGAKIAEAAEKAGKKPQDFVDSLIPKFQNAWKKLNIEYDEFIRTTDSKHEKIVQDLVTKLQKNGYVAKRKYEGLYCVGCEKYYNESELLDGKCPDHKTKCIRQSEENYFFLLAKAAKDTKLYEKIKKDEIKVAPEARKNEILGKIKAGLEDVSISRENVEWGIKFPGDESQTIYVWVDALINYFSATKIYKNGPVWPADLHLMAKDILWFHAIIWPSFLMAVGEKPPKEVFAHGFFTINGQKMSKSIGNVIDPVKIAEKYGADALRYALLREFPFGEDGDISEEKIAEIYGSELAAGLGNLISRVLTMTVKYLSGEIPHTKRNIDEHELRVGGSFNWKKAYKIYDESVENLQFNRALEAISKVVKTCDQYIDKEKPWEISDDKEELRWIIRGLLETIHQIAWMVYPFMPDISQKIARNLSIKGLLGKSPDIKESWSFLDENTKVKKPEPLFPRIEK